MRPIKRLHLVLGIAAATPLPALAQTMSPATWDRLLRAHVRGGLVDYDAITGSPGFQEYLRTVAATSPARMPRNDQLAYWINAYNAYTRGGQRT